MTITLKNYTFKISPGENLHHWKYINASDWEPDTFKIFDHFITKNSSVLDIGAWSGILTLYAAKTAHKVYAIDPDPVCYKELEQNILLNPDISYKIQTFNIGISDKSSTLNLSARNAYGQSSSSILKRRRDKKNALNINTTSLLEFLNTQNIKKIDFIKMDVEGAEFKILPTINKSLEQLNYPTLFISFHYTFLNEHIYYKNITSLVFTKVLMKFEKLFNFSFFRKEIHNEISNLFNAFKDYDYIYKTDGSLIAYNYLVKNPALIKDTDLVFTNTKWITKA